MSTVEANIGREYVEKSLNALQHFKRDGSRIIGDCTPVYEFMLKHGKEYSGLPWSEFRGTGWRRMKPNHCFENAWKAACRYPGLKYCEGYAYAGVIPVHHAWCVDDLGRAIDFTWRETIIRKPANEWEYFGVTFQTTALARIMAGNGHWSCLFDLPYETDPEKVLSLVA